MRVASYLFGALFLGLSAFGATLAFAATGALSPETEMAFTLKDVVTYCGMVAGLGVTYATMQGQIKEAKRVAEEADAKADAFHRRLDDINDSVTGVRLEISGLKGEVHAFSDSRFEGLSGSLRSLHEALAKAGLFERRGNG